MSEVRDVFRYFDRCRTRIADLILSPRAEGGVLPVPGGHRQPNMLETATSLRWEGDVLFTRRLGGDGPWHRVGRVSNDYLLRLATRRGRAMSAEGAASRSYRCMCGGWRQGCGCRLTDPPSYWDENGRRRFYDEEPPGAGADPYGRTAEDWARHAE